MIIPFNLKWLNEAIKLIIAWLGCAPGPHGLGPKEVNLTREDLQVGSSFKVFYGPDLRVPGRF